MNQAYGELKSKKGKKLTEALIKQQLEIGKQVAGGKKFPITDRTQIFIDALDPDKQILGPLSTKETEFIKQKLESPSVKLKNIETLEKSLGIQKNTWTRFMNTGAMPAPDNSISSAKMYETMRNSMSPNERRGYDMEQQNYDRRRNKEIKQEKVQEFRLKAAAKAKAAAPAKAMAEEIVQSIKRNPIIDEVLTRSEARLQPSSSTAFIVLPSSSFC